MDEILIEEKKYVSSKQAAKITGYAKDYIGQLCREGRVPARLVGRSWYVLETAIQDHRFGNPEVVVPERPKSAPQASIASTWAPPRYEASSEALLPSVNRPQDNNTTEPEITSPSSANTQEREDETQHIEDSWKAWFDRFDHAVDAEAEASAGVASTDEGIIEAEGVMPVDAEEIKNEEVEEKPKPESEAEVGESIEVSIPIHTLHQPLYQPPPEELLPRTTTVEAIIDTKQAQNKKVAQRKGSRDGGKTARVMRIIGIMLAIIISAIAIAGSGYFDEYMLSNSQTRMIAGMALYNK
ncbi:MAG: helix-turn-helix domain-containing protein [Candidatus Paceibacterota bacterium]|jgi:hypothetical protein